MYKEFIIFLQILFLKSYLIYKRKKILINLKPRLCHHTPLLIVHIISQTFCIQVVYLKILKNLQQHRKKIILFLNLNLMDYLQNIKSKI
jgi:hypothetical protein